MDGLTRDETIALLEYQILQLYNRSNRRNGYNTTTEETGRMLERAIVFNKAVEAFDIGGDLDGAN